MLHSVKTYVSDRRQGIIKVAGIAGGVYLVRRYMLDRFQEMQEKLQEERVARERCVTLSTSKP
jgi:peroxin-3